jgi:hypothetical protein
VELKAFEPSCRCRRWKTGALTRAIRGGSEDGVATGGSEGGGESPIVTEEAFAIFAEDVGEDGNRSGARNEIWPETQSIDGSWRVSQLCPSTAEQLASNGVT